MKPMAFGLRPSGPMRKVNLSQERPGQQDRKSVARGPVGRLYQVAARGLRFVRKAERRQRADAQCRAADDTGGNRRGGAILRLAALSRCPIGSTLTSDEKGSARIVGYPFSGDRGVLSKDSTSIVLARRHLPRLALGRAQAGPLAFCCKGSRRWDAITARPSFGRTLHGPRDRECATLSFWAGTFPLRRPRWPKTRQSPLCRPP